MPGTGGDGDNNRPGGEPPGMASSSQPVASGEPATSPSNRPGGVSPSSPSPGATVAVGGSHDYLRSIDEAVEFAMSRGLGIAISVPNGNLFTVPNMVLADDWSVGVHMLRELAARIERHVQGTDDNNGDPEFAGIGSSGGGASAYGNVGNTGGLASGKDDQGIRGPDPERTQVRPQAKTPKKVHYEELSTGPSTPEPRLRGLAASRWNQPGTGINSSSDNIPSRRSSKAATTPDQVPPPASNTPPTSVFTSSDSGNGRRRALVTSPSSRGVRALNPSSSFSSPPPSSFSGSETAAGPSTLRTMERDNRGQAEKRKVVDQKRNSKGKEKEVVKNKEGRGNDTGKGKGKKRVENDFSDAHPNREEGKGQSDSELERNIAELF